MDQTQAEGMIGPHQSQDVAQSASSPFILDVRGPGEYAAGHIPGAVNIPFVELADRLAEVPEDRPVVTYCMMQHRGQSRGERAAALLCEHGRQAHVLDGGLPAWQASGLAIVSAEPPR